MEVISKTKSVRVSPRKVRLIAEAVKKMSINDAIKNLEVIKKRGAYPLLKTLKSAVANAVNNAKHSQDTLFIKAIDVVEGPAFKRFHASTRGRVHPFKKRSSHIRIVLGVKEEAKEVKKEIEKKLNKEEKEEVKEVKEDGTKS
ncbi:MAG: 50S ribosomal protein L22 [Candidatus Levyibacteriota bacterium]